MVMSLKLWESDRWLDFDWLGMTRGNYEKFDKAIEKMEGTAEFFKSY